MGLGTFWSRLAQVIFQTHGDVKSFEKEVEAAGIAGRREGGMREIPTRKVVGSVGRAQNLRSDFFYKTGKAMTARFVSIGKAMEAGKVLPPIEVYKAKLRRRRGDQDVEQTEYYVVDGHHRVAMARKLGQDYLDAHVVEYKVAPPAAGTEQTGTPTEQPPSPPAPAPTPPPALPEAPMQSAAPPLDEPKGS